MLDKILEYISTEPIVFIIDISLSVLVIITLIISFIKTRKTLANSLRTISLIILGIVSAIFDIKILLYVVFFLTFALAVNNFFYISNDEKKTHRKNANIENTKLTAESKEQIIDTIVRTIDYLAARKMGAIITFERNESLNSYIEKSVKIDAVLTPELIKTIFFPNTALHDGAVIIQNGKVACAGAYYPLSDKSDIPSSLGTRHRAAIGISEEYDCLSIIISEETGYISYTLDGTITTAINIETLKNILEQNLLTD